LFDTIGALLGRALEKRADVFTIASHSSYAPQATYSMSSRKSTGRARQRHVDVVVVV
jgi:hypothetical protein